MSCWEMRWNCRSEESKKQEAAFFPDSGFLYYDLLACILSRILKVYRKNQLLKLHLKYDSSNTSTLLRWRM